MTGDIARNHPWDPFIHNSYSFVFTPPPLPYKLTLFQTFVDRRVWTMDFQNRGGNQKRTILFNPIGNFTNRV